MITVIGLGFVGLTTALGLSSKGHKVFGYEVDDSRRGLIQKGQTPFYEPSLDDALRQFNGKDFQVTETLADAVAKSEVIFLCVGTPSDASGSANLKYLYEAIGSVLTLLKKDSFKTLVIKSTVPPGTTLEVKSFVENKGFKVGEDIGLVNNPEFLREGKAWEDFVHPDRIVIGECDAKSGDVLAQIYKTFGAPVFRVSPNTGEFIKYLSNTMLASMISFANEMSMAAGRFGGIDVREAFTILHADRRWSGSPSGMASYVYPGCGFGGACLPKDTQAMIAQIKKSGGESALLQEVLRTNARVKDFVVNRIKSVTQPDETVGILGLAFKPDSDDVRNSSSKDIISLLIKEGYKKIVVYDPKASDNFRKEFNLPIEYAQSLDQIISLSSALVLLTAWPEFIRNKDKLNSKKLLDFRYAIKKEEKTHESNYDLSHV